DDEALLQRRGDGRHDRRRSSPRRVRVHAGVSRRADDARREDHADLRRHESNPAARDRTRDVARLTKVELTSADRVLFPDDGITKADLFDYYAAVAAVLLPHLHDRPFTMKRWREGLE